jgi:hypothetical protein
MQLLLQPQVQAGEQDIFGFLHVSRRVQKPSSMLYYLHFQRGQSDGICFEFDESKRDPLCLRSMRGAKRKVKYADKQARHEFLL